MLRDVSSFRGKNFLKFGPSLVFLLPHLCPSNEYAEKFHFSNAETTWYASLLSHPSPSPPHPLPSLPSPPPAVEYSYQGPRLDGDITAEFMQDLLQWFKEEKKLHKKYAYKVSGMSLFLFSSSLSLFSVPSYSFPSFAVEHVLLPPDNSQCEEYI